MATGNSRLWTELQERGAGEWRWKTLQDELDKLGGPFEDWLALYILVGTWNRTHPRLRNYCYQKIRSFKPAPTQNQIFTAYARTTSGDQVSQWAHSLMMDWLGEDLNLAYQLYKNDPAFADTLSGESFGLWYDKVRDRDIGTKIRRLRQQAFDIISAKARTVPELRILDECISNSYHCYAGNIKGVKEATAILIERLFQWVS